MRTCALLLACLPALAQLQFEAATVKVSKGDTKGAAGFSRSGQFVAPNATLKGLVLLAYNVHEREVEGAPSWFDSDHFDVVAKAAPDTKFDDMRLMVRSLLASQFGLKIHTEEKVLPVYALSVAKRGSKLQASAAEQAQCAPGQSVRPGMMHLTCRMVTQASLAGVLFGMSAGYLEGVPVVDQTGLDGTWDFTLDYTPKAQYEAGSSDRPVLSFFEAVEEQLGLRLELKKLPVPILVIDRVNRAPTGE